MAEASFRINPDIGGKKVGIILPSVNCIIEPEFYAVAPKGISFHSTRLLLEATTPEALIKMEEGIEAASKILSTIQPHAVVFACTSGSLIKGRGYDLEITEKLECICGCPVITTATVMLQAVKAFGARKIALATPYLDVVNEHEVVFFRDNGIEVAACQGLGLSGPQMREQTPQTVYDLVMRTDVPEAEAIFISCTDFRAMEVIDLLEQKLEKPILCSNQVILWDLLKKLGVSQKIKNYGRLLAEMP